MKTKHNKLVLVAVFFLISAANLFAQPTVLPYKNGFETAANAADWTMVSDPNNLANRWFIGPAVKLSGNQSLYVSADGGITANYNDVSQSTIFAYSTFTLPAYHSYSIYFDWRSRGAIGDSLYVCWVTDGTPIAPAAGGALPAWVTATKKLVLGGLINGNEFDWGEAETGRAATFSVCGTGQPAKLVFVWRNNGDGLGPSTSPSAFKSPAGSIDNLQINQNLDLNYKTGFDNGFVAGSSSPQQGWRLENRVTFVNKWCFGSADYLSPGGALYISNDGGTTHGYSDNRGFCSAIKEITLPKGEQFTVDFDWKAGDPSGDYIKFGYLTDSTRLNTALSNTNLPPAWFIGTELKNSILWQHHTQTFTGTGKPERLVFMWVNDLNINNKPAGIIDNVSIRKTNSTVCQRPVITGTVINSGGITVSWTGNADRYNLSYTYQKPMCRDEDQRGEFITVNNVTSPYTITNINRGYYSVFVDGICVDAFESCGANGNMELKNDTATQTRYGIESIINAGCIDFTNLAAARAQTGTWSGAYLPSSPTVTVTGNAIINNGPDNYTATRHTVHTIPKYDPIASELRTIPECEMVSVRLGSDISGGKWEGLEYTINVDSTYALIIMKYATVLEAPGHNGDYESQVTATGWGPHWHVPPPFTETNHHDPRITLELFNSNGQIINQYCTDVNMSSYQGILAYYYGSDPSSANYNPAWHDPTWHFIPKNTVQLPSGGMNSEPFFWKDWTTVGVNLRYPVDLRGQTIKVRIRNFDCSPGAHWGYSYFTLDCARAGLDGLSCGGNTIDVIEAPKEGFTHCWYKKFGGSPDNCVSTNSSFTPATNDTATYICKITSIASPTCSFELTAVLKPHWPHSAYSFTQTPGNCKNNIQLTDKSYMVEGETPKPNEKPETFQWVVTEQNGDVVFSHSIQIPPGSTTVPNPPTFPAPPEGATYNLMIVTGVSDNECTDTLRQVLTIPSIIKPVKDTINKQICDAQLPYYYPVTGKTYTAAGVYLDTLIGKINSIGCDSVSYIKLIVLDKVYEEVYDTICYNTSITWNGITCNATQDYPFLIPNGNVAGCDSIVTLHLFVRNEALGDTAAVLCYGESIMWGGVLRTTNGFYDEHKTGVTGCDSVVTLHLTIREELRGDTTVVICDGESIMWGGELRTTDGLYDEIRISTGCDSTVTLKLTVSPVMNIILDKMPEFICLEDPAFIISYQNIGGSTPTRYILTFDETAKNAGFGAPDGILEIMADNTNNIVIPKFNPRPEPNHYGVNIRFIDDLYNCSGAELNLDLDVDFTVSYSKTVIEQKWNNVLAVLNYNFNGDETNDGYTFTGFRWFRNGNPINPPETNSYLHISSPLNYDDGVSTDYYHVELERFGYKPVSTCPFYPVFRQQGPQYPTVVSGGTFYMRAKNGGTITFMYVSGIVLNRQSFSAGDNYIQSPPQQGFYIMVIEEEGQIPVKQILVVK